MITAMRHLLGPGEAFKTKNNGDAVLIPAGLTIFHGTLGRYDWRIQSVELVRDSHELSRQHDRRALEAGQRDNRRFRSRIYEFVTTRPLKLQLANAKGWTFALRAKAPIVDDELDKDDILASGFDGIISPYFKKEMRIGPRRQIPKARARARDRWRDDRIQWQEARKKDESPRPDRHRRSRRIRTAGIR